MSQLLPLSPQHDINQFLVAAMEHRSNDFFSPLGDVLISQILNNLREGVIITDSQGIIKFCNLTMESLTGITGQCMLGQRFSSKLLGLCDDQGDLLSESECPWLRSFQSHQTSSGNYRVIGPSGREIRVELDILPLMGSCNPSPTKACGLDHPRGDRNQEASSALESPPSNGGSSIDAVGGMLILLHDASVQNSLKRQLKDLFESSMVDPLTKVFNRAEFERVFDQYIEAKKKSKEFKCSLIVCDIDFFKAINDNYNHHVGDQTLIAFADVLKKFIRSHDIVARFGGEEFLILCGNCDQATALVRAEEIRVALTRTAMPMLDGKCVTASFGVAELLEHETATQLFVRADSALFQAKETGRNRVVGAQIGETGSAEELANSDVAVSGNEGVSLAGGQWKKKSSLALIDEEYVTTTPLTVLVEKMRGYILEVNANVLRAEQDYAKFQVSVPDPQKKGRVANLAVEIEFQTPLGTGKVKRPETYLHIVISAGQRKWFSADPAALAKPLLLELRRFFMINDEKSRLTIDRAVTKSTRK